MSDDASRVVIQLIGDTAQFDSSSTASARTFDANMSKIAASAERAEQQVVRSTGAISFATRDLGFQISDIGTQLAGGQSPFLIFAQQGPQVANAISEISAAGAGLGTVLSGVAIPALLAIVGVVTTLTSKSYDAADAHKAHAAAAKSTEEAIHDLDVAMGKAITTTQQETQAHYDSARALFAEEVKTRNLTIAKLQQAKAERDAAREVGGVGGGTGGAALPQTGAQNRVDDLQSQIDAQNKAIVEGGQAVIRSAIPIALQKVKEATDAVAAANGRYQRSLAKLNEQFQKTGDRNAYEDSLTRITRARDADIDAANRHARAHRGLTDAEREAAKAAREAAAAQRELDQIYDSITKQFEPAVAALNDYHEALADIDKLVRAGRFTPEQAADAQIGANQRYTKSIEKIDQANTDAIFGKGYKPFPDKLPKTGQKTLDETFEAQEKSQKKLYDRQQHDIRSLADFYERAFDGGVGSIWKTFKQEGEKEIAYLLAKLTVSKVGGLFGLSTGGGLGGGTGGVGGLLGGIGKLFGGGGHVTGEGSVLSSLTTSNSAGLKGILGSFGGFASGGYAAPNSIHRVNESGGGVELLRMGSQGGTVIPLGQTKAAAGGSGMTVVQHISVDGRNSVTPADFARQIVMTANGLADQMDARRQGATLSATPGTVRRTQVMKG